MRISDWSSDVCSSDLYESERLTITARDGAQVPVSIVYAKGFPRDGTGKLFLYGYGAYGLAIPPRFSTNRLRSEEHTSELQSLMRISYAVFCLKKQKTHK